MKRIRPDGARARLAAWLGVAALLAPVGAAAPALADRFDEITTTRYFCKHKPNYFVLGAAEKGRSNPTTKFHFSFQYMLWDFTQEPDPSRPEETPAPDTCAKPVGRHQVKFGYSQKSIWSLYAESAPFEENNYNPEIYYGYKLERLEIDWLTFGIEHESNGEGGDDSRSWNRVYTQARWNFKLGPEHDEGEKEAGDSTGWDRWYGRIDAKIWWPFMVDDEEIDLIDFVGYGKLTGSIGTPETPYGSAEVDLEVTKGGTPIEFDHASVQLGLSYRWPFGRRLRFLPYLYVQYFEGFGETLVRADDHTRAFRVGLRLR